MTNAVQDDLLAAELIETLGRIRRHTRRRTERPWPLDALSLAQLDLMRVVRRRPGISVAGAAAELGVAANTVSTLVSSLVAAGMLRRTRDPDDRRAAQLFLSPQSTRRVNRWRDQRTAVVSAALDNLAPQERTAIAKALPALARLATELSPERP
jgi:DNA-binding MarR family transcriptional regulator